MKSSNRSTTFATIAGLTLAFLPGAASACSVCMGASGTKSADALNGAIFLMFGFLAVILGSIGAFIFNLKKRSQAPVPPHVELSQITTPQQDTH